MLLKLLLEVLHNFFHLPVDAAQVNKAVAKTESLALALFVLFCHWVSVPKERVLVLLAAKNRTGVAVMGNVLELPERLYSES